MAKGRILRKLSLDEISAVDVPCQEGARMTLMKRAEDPDDIIAKAGDTPMKTDGGKKFPASDFAYVPDPQSPSTWKLRLTSTPGGNPDPGIVGAAAAALGPSGYRGNRVQIPAADRAKVVARVRAAWMKANPDKKADEMPGSIKKGDDLADTLANLFIEKSDVASATFGEAWFQRQVGQTIWPMLDAFRQSACSIIEDESLDQKAKVDKIKQSAAEFVAMVQQWVPAAMPAVQKALADGSKENEMEKAELEAKLADLTKKLETADAVLKLSADERSHYDGLDETGRAAFLAKSADARATEIADKAAKNSVIYKALDGAEYRQSDDPRLVQMAKDRDIEKKRTDGLIEKAELSEFTKSAETVYGDLPGEPLAKAKGLRAIAKLDEADRNAIETMLKAGNKALGDLTKARGYSGPGRMEGGAEQQFNAAASEFAKGKDMTREAAAAKFAETPEGQELYAKMVDEQKARARAA